MSAFIEFALLGITSGALTSLLAVAMVVAYRGSRVVNFAQGAIAMVGTYVFFDLHITHGQSYILSFVAGIATSAAISVAMHFLVLHRLRNAPQVTKIIVTLGVMIILSQWETLHASPSTLFVPSALSTHSVQILSASIPEGQLVILGIVVVLCIALSLVYKYTQLGRATTAALDNSRALSALGYSPSRLAAVNWALSGALAGTAGILLAPISGLGVSTYALLILPVLAAAVLGRFTSIWWALAGGLIVGFVQSEMGWYVRTQGWSDAAPFLILIVVLVIRGIGSVPRSAPAQRLPRVGDGIIKLRYFVPILIILFALTQIVKSQFWLGAIVVTAGSAIVLLSFVIVTGYSGQLSLAQFAFAGLGLFFSGKLVQAGHVPVMFAVILGILFVAPIGYFLGTICLRVSGTALAVLTLGFAAAVEFLLFDGSSFQGASGIQLGTVKLFGLNISGISEPNRYAALSVIMLMLAAAVTANVRRGVAGRRLLAMRANERAASSLGINVVQSKLFAFTIGSMVAALGGIVLGFSSSVIVFTQFDTIPSVQDVAQAIIGGVGWIPGAFMGGMIQSSGVISQALNQWVGSSYTGYVPIVTALLLLVVISKQPDGGAPIMASQLKWLGSKLRFGKPRAKKATKYDVVGEGSDDNTEVRVAPMSLRVRGLGVTFGGSVAVDDLSFEVNPGEIVGLIGPNGAGKSTAVDAVTGYVNCRSDEITLGDQSLVKMSATARARAGIRRSFQSLELFDDLSIIDNLAAATDPISNSHFFLGIFHPRRLTMNPVTMAAIKAFKLTDKLDLSPGELSYGTRRLLAIARAVASGPSILMLDEPAAGLDDAERQELVEVLKILASDWGMGILLIEHDVPLVMGTCDRIYALDLGKLIAVGTPAEVRQDPHVIVAFLGSSHDEVPV